jgi:hypothetical protein
MAEKTAASQVQQMFTPEGWRKAYEDQMGRLAQVMDEAAKMQTMWQTSAQSSIDELASLMKSSIKYTAELSHEMRKMTLDAAKKTSELFAS